MSIVKQGLSYTYMTTKFLLIFVVFIVFLIAMNTILKIETAFWFFVCLRSVFYTVLIVGFPIFFTHYAEVKHNDVLSDDVKTKLKKSRYKFAIIFLVFEVLLNYKELF